MGSLQQGSDGDREQPRTVAHKTRIWVRFVEPAVAHLKINDVTEEDVGAIVRRPLHIDDAGRIIKGKAEAASTYRTLHHLFHKALQWKLRTREAGNR